MRVGLFFDFDGTLSPLDTSREDASLSSELVDVLSRLIDKYRIAIISSKDCWFLKRKVPNFINGFGCINGAETTVAGFVIVDESIVNNTFRPAFEKILSEAKKAGLKVEVKQSLIGHIGGLSIDWKDLGSMPAEVKSLINVAKDHGLHVIGDPNLWFADIYASRRNKGDSIRVLRALLNLDRVVYFGDSYNDIPAFRESDIKVLVQHRFNKGFNPPDINFRVRFEDLPRWLLNVSTYLV